MIGLRIRDIRKSRKLSQQALAERLNVSYQQIQKYETGKNRVSAVRLLECAIVLDVSVFAFYEPLYRQIAASQIVPISKA